MARVRVTMEFDAEVEGYAMHDPLTPGIVEQLRDAGIPIDAMGMARSVELEVME